VRMEKRLFTPPEVARLLGVGSTTVRWWIKRGRIRAVRTPGGQFRIPLEEVERLKIQMGLSPSSRALTVSQILDSLNLQSVGDRAVFGALLECLSETGTREFTPSRLSSLSGYPPESCRRFCEVMAAYGYLTRGEENQIKIAKGLEGERTYKLTVEVKK